MIDRTDASRWLGRLKEVMEGIIECLEANSFEARLRELQAEYMDLFERLFGGGFPVGAVSEAEAVEILAMQKSCMALIDEKKAMLMEEMKRCRGTKKGLMAYGAAQCATRR